MQELGASFPTSSESDSRPTTPDPQMTNSLHRANTTIDELTATLAKVSRAPSPDPEDRDFLHCCCGREDCANTAAWASFQSKLESRLILCAEVGQALLEKHEAYVRRHGLDDSDDQDQSDNDGYVSRPETPTIHSARQDRDLEPRVAGLQRENIALEKKLNAALLNAEIAESSKKSLLQELEQTKDALAKLTVNQAKSTGWETRLNAVAQEKDDLRQELDSERQRAKNAEAHAVAMKERCIKLQSELGRAYDELDQQKQSRTELTEEILRDARARLEMVQQQHFGRTVLSESPEVTQVMESLVAENEALKRDVAELQNLLTEAREDVRTLQEQVEESRVLPVTMSRVPSSIRPGHHYAHSWASSFGQAPLSPISRTAGEPSYRPQTPSTEARPPSPEESRGGSERRFQALSSPRPRYPPSPLNLDVDYRNARIKSPDAAGRKSPRRPLFLLSHDKAVQTDEVNWTTFLAPVLQARTDEGSSSTPPGDIHSESSSLADAYTHASTIAAVVDKTNALFSRMAQADARTLTNRLKRQRLAGDVSHLSHATVSSILSDSNGLRAHFRGVLEDERSISTCTRRDLRALLSLLREMFAELGQMRVALNDIILDPSLAPKFSEAAMDPLKQLNDIGMRIKHSNAGGWMGPLSKLFGVPIATPPDTGKTSPHPPRVISPAAPDTTLRQKPPRFVPKSGPALAATATTVNVEFSGTGTGRSVASSSAVDLDSGREVAQSNTPGPGTLPVPARSVMSIFAGAPPSQSDDPWVLLPTKSDRRVKGQKSSIDIRTATLTRAVGLRARLPRNVDAVVDSGSAIQDTEEDETNESNVPDTLLERTLRPRGLSDSSIRTSFLNDGSAPTSPAANATETPAPTPISLVPVRPLPQIRTLPRQSANPVPGSLRTSLLQSFSRAFTNPSSSSSTSADVPPSPTSTSHKSDNPPDRSASPRGMHILPSIAGWAAAKAGLDAEAADDFVGSVRDETAFGRPAWHRDMLGRDI